MSKKQALRNLFGQYDLRGFWKANEFLLPPDKALMFALDLGEIGVGIQVVSTWIEGISVDGEIGYREDLANELVISEEIDAQDDAVAQSVSMAVDFIDHLPLITDYVSFTLSVPPSWY